MSIGCYVSAPGYVAAQYGQRQAAEEGTGVEVRGRQITSRVDVRLQPAAIISGRIFDDAGEGLAGVEIELLAKRYLPGGVSPVAVGFAQTEASGFFRVGDLQEGEYYVRAYVPAAVRPSKGDGTQAYAPTYFPQAPRIEEAQPILVVAGQELFDVNFALAAVRKRVRQRHSRRSCRVADRSSESPYHDAPGRHVQRNCTRILERELRDPECRARRLHAPGGRRGGVDSLAVGDAPHHRRRRRDGGACRAAGGAPRRTHRARQRGSASVSIRGRSKWDSSSGWKGCRERRTWSTWFAGRSSSATEHFRLRARADRFLPAGLTAASELDRQGHPARERRHHRSGDRLWRWRASAGGDCPDRSDQRRRRARHRPEQSRRLEPHGRRLSGEYKPLEGSVPVRSIGPAPPGRLVSNRGPAAGRLSRGCGRVAPAERVERSGSARATVAAGDSFPSRRGRASHGPVEAVSDARRFAGLVSHE